MCGIIGYTGQNNAVPYLLKGLYTLEYRGYDSSGIAVSKSEKIKVIKSAGRICALEEKLKKEKCDCKTGIGHTRWATHGQPNTKNAHPHQSQTGLFTIVHNGIIENYSLLKTKLEKDGFVFDSETDSEVIAQLLEQNYHENAVATFCKVLNELEGSFAIAALCKNEPNKIICAKRQSPLVIAKGKNESFLASDATALLPYSNEIYTLGDDEIAVLNGSDVEFFNMGAVKIQKHSEIYNLTYEQTQKDGYEHFMLKEIMQQPKVISDTVKAYVKNGDIVFDKLKITKNDLQNIDSVYLVACGSAYHVSLTGEYIIEKLCSVSAKAVIASEFRYRNIPLNERTLVVVISQSGETADTLAALRLAKEKKAKTISIVNVLSSTIAKESGSVIYTPAGPEIAVATTKAYSVQLVVVYLLALYFCDTKCLLSKSDKEKYLFELSTLSQKVEEILKEKSKYEEISKRFEKAEHSYFIGRNTDFAAAMEGSLKLKEISYIHCEAYAAGELKHGTISLISNETVVTAVCCLKDIFKKTLSNIQEIKSRGAFVIVLVPESRKDEITDADEIITLPDTDEIFLPSLEVIPLQLISYYTAKRRNCDIDKPRNLAKSVTVE